MRMSEGTFSDVVAHIFKHIAPDKALFFHPESTDIFLISA